MSMTDDLDHGAPGGTGATDQVDELDEPLGGDKAPDAEQGSAPSAAAPTTGARRPGRPPAPKTGKRRKRATAPRPGAAERAAKAAAAKAEREAAEAAAAAEMRSNCARQAEFLSVVGFSMAARYYGDHWRLNPEEATHLGGALGPVLEKYADSFGGYEVELLAVAALGQVILEKRGQGELLQSAGGGSDGMRENDAAAGGMGEDSESTGV